MRSASDRPGAARLPRLPGRLCAVLAAAAALVPLSPAGVAAALDQSDATLVVKVRQAGLWEMPSGMWTETRSNNPKVKEVGRALMIDHGRLDVVTRSLAGDLGVALPAEPTTEQQGWLAEMRNARAPEDFDRIFANRLRAAHGQILAIIAQVRAGTRDDRIRAYATTANQAVMRHITLLESTGLIDYTALPSANVATTSAPSGQGGLALSTMDVLTAGALVLVLGGGIVFGLRRIKGHRGQAAAAVSRTRTGESHG
ncbi:DUF4142 domain-containing protein [Amycolatopsis sp. NPDC059021]|uniref:DUF4142 domain-containing protein n=1 Tax=Amycolatopsis sp. NPDC059021 TaxID=3346704 RepID=UPI00366E2796